MYKHIDENRNEDAPIRVELVKRQSAGRSPRAPTIRPKVRACLDRLLQRLEEE